MQINERRKRLLGGIYEYVGHIAELAVNQNRKLILWGYGKGGAFLEHILRDIYQDLNVEYIIDEYITITGTANSNIFRSSLFQYIDNSQYIVLSTIQNAGEIEKTLQKYGYIKGQTWFDVRKDIGGSYLEYLQKTVGGMDFTYVTKEDRPDLYSGEFYESKPFDHSSVDSVFEEIATLDENPAFFDIGCGKGQLLLMAYLAGIDCLGGIEWNKEIHSQALLNMELLGIPCNIRQGDATRFTEFDDYNIFFLYNPFGPDNVAAVVKNIQASYARNHRDIYLAYGNPFFHERVIGEGGFQLYRQIRVDLYDPLLNIYRLDGNRI